MVDEFELFKARSYTGGNDTTAITIASSPRSPHKKSNRELKQEDDVISGDVDDNSNGGPIDVLSAFRPRRLECPVSGTPRGALSPGYSGGSHRRHSAVGLPSADSNTIDNPLTLSYKRTEGCGGRKSLDGGETKVLLGIVVNSWSENRRRSGSWQGEISSSSLPPEVSPTLDDSRTESRKNSACGSISGVSINGAPAAIAAVERSTPSKSPSVCSASRRNSSGLSPSSGNGNRLLSAIPDTPPGNDDFASYPSQGLAAAQNIPGFRRRSTTYLNSVFTADVFPVAIRSSSPSAMTANSAAASRNRRSSSPRCGSKSPPCHQDVSSGRHTGGTGGRRNSAITYLTSGYTSTTVNTTLLAPSYDGRRRCSLQTQGDSSSPFWTSPSANRGDDDVHNGNFNETKVVDRVSTSSASVKQLTAGVLVGENGSDGCEIANAINPIVLCRIGVFGAQQVGKTTLIDQLLTSEYLANRTREDNGRAEDDSPAAKSTLILLDNVEYQVEFVECRSLDVNQLFDVCLVVYSVTDRRSFDYAQLCLRQFSESAIGCKTRRHSRRGNCRNRETDDDVITTGGGFVVMLVANKNDLVRTRVVSTADGKKQLTKSRFATALGCQFMEVSALLDHKVDEVLTGVVRAFQRRCQRQDRRRSGPRMNDDNDDQDTISINTADGKGCIQRAAYAVLCRLIK